MSTVAPTTTSKNAKPAPTPSAATPSPASSEPFPGRAAIPSPIAAPIGGKEKPTNQTSGRMKLSAITRGRIHGALFLVLFAIEGIGKTSFGAAAPDPVFLCAENGTEELDIERFPEPHTWPEVLEAVDELLYGEHSRKTLVVDTLDWIVPMLHAYICERDNKASIEAYGYGKGFDAAVDEFRVLLSRLEELRKKRGMNIVLLAHMVVRTFKNPEADDYDRYEMKLHHKIGALLREACHAVLFANKETAVIEKDSGRSKAISTGRRVIFTTGTAAFDAKNRYSLPEKLNLDWDEFEGHVLAGRQIANDVDRLLGDVEKIDPATAKAGRDWVRKPRTFADMKVMKEKLQKRLETAA